MVSLYGVQQNGGHIVHSHMGIEASAFTRFYNFALRCLLLLYSVDVQTNKMLTMCAVLQL